MCQYHYFTDPENSGWTRIEYPDLLIWGIWLLLFRYIVDSEDNSQKGLKIKTFQNKDGISETISSLAAAATH